MGGVYHSKTSKVHGLWPEVGSYGTSRCIKPRNTSNPTQIYSCYKEPSDKHALWFEDHEWTKHGRCAGGKDADDFFRQVCNLSVSPVRVLETAKEARKRFFPMVRALKKAGFPVWALDKWHDQILLSACARDDGRWTLSPGSQMSSKCVGPSPTPGPGPSPPTPSPQCIPRRKGPKCARDADCEGLPRCIRCAKSGFCTDQPLVARTLV